MIEVRRRSSFDRGIVEVAYYPDIRKFSENMRFFFFLHISTSIYLKKIDRAFRTQVATFAHLHKPTICAIKKNMRATSGLA